MKKFQGFHKIERLTNEIRTILWDRSFIRFSSSFFLGGAFDHVNNEVSLQRNLIIHMIKCTPKKDEKFLKKVDIIPHCFSTIILFRLFLLLFF